MTPLAKLEKKLRRALKNGEGTRLLPTEIGALVELGVMETLASAVNEEMKQQWLEKQARLSSATTGSTKGAAGRRKSGKSRSTTKTHEASAIEALVASM